MRDTIARLQDRGSVLPVADDEIRVQADDGLQRKETRVATLRWHLLFSHWYL